MQEMNSMTSDNVILIEIIHLASDQQLTFDPAHQYWQVAAILVRVDPRIFDSNRETIQSNISLNVPIRFANDIWSQILIQLHQL